jgi:hypothetical protein
MSVRRAILALAMTSALIATAISAPTASAATSGTTAFTCTKEATEKPFSDEHCLTKPGGNANTFGHVAIAEGTETAITGSNAKTASSTTAAFAPILTTTFAGGIALEIKCTGVTSTGALKNQLLGEEHHITGSGIVLTYTGCTVPVPAGQECRIAGGGIITTNSLKATSNASGVLFESTSGGAFTTLSIEGCRSTFLNGSFPITGSVTAIPNGATLEVTKASSESTLKFAGQKATLQQIETLRMKEGNPIVATKPSPPVTSGTTAFTCTKGATLKPFSDEHCLNRPGGNANTFGHVAIAEGTETATTGSNAKTASSTTAAFSPVLNGTIGGVAVEIRCTNLSSTGSLKNQRLGEEHHITATGIIVTYSGCTVPSPEGQECEVVGNNITTNSLKATSNASGAVFEPTSGTAFTTVFIEGCKNAALNGSFPVTGSVTAIPKGATLEVTKASSESTLKFAGQTAALQQVETLRMKEGSPIATTGPPFEASAPTPGTTAFTCTKEAPKKPFSDEHCLTRPGGTANTFGHVAIAEGTETAITGSNVKTASSTTAAFAPILSGKIAGIGVEIKCTSISSTGTLKNQLLGEEHHITGSGIIVTYTGCVVPQPAGNECEVVGGNITTNSLKATSSASGAIFEPTSGTSFTNIVIDGCKNTALNGSFPVTGSVTAIPNGATLEVTKATSESTLKFAGQTATLQQIETLRMKEGSPIVATKAPFGVE